MIIKHTWLNEVSSDMDPTVPALLLSCVGLFDTDEEVEEVEEVREEG